MFQIFVPLAFLALINAAKELTVENENTTVESTTKLTEAHSSQTPSTVVPQNDSTPAHTEDLNATESTRPLTEIELGSEVLPGENITESTIPISASESGEKNVSEPIVAMEGNSTEASESTTFASIASETVHPEVNVITESTIAAAPEELASKQPKTSENSAIAPPGTFESPPAPNDIGDTPRSGAIYEKTDGLRKSCHSHTDCYEMREPKAWCELKIGESWTGEGCYCDHKINSCIVELKKLGMLYYTDCLPMSKWECSPQ